MALSFPPTPYLYQVVHRHDLNLTCMWNGTYWLTENETHLSHSFGAGVTATADAYLAIDTAYNIYVTRVVTPFFVATTNTSSHYWQFSVHAIATAFTAAFTTRSSGPGGVYSADAWGIDTATLTFAGSGVKTLLVRTAKVGSPGALYGACGVYYRKIVPNS